ncbi:hypothetical protein MRX96_007535 [Rhipicephalus microplus]
MRLSHIARFLQSRLGRGATKSNVAESTRAERRRFFLAAQIRPSPCSLEESKRWPVSPGSKMRAGGGTQWQPARCGVEKRKMEGKEAKKNWGQVAHQSGEGEVGANRESRREGLRED